MSNLLSDVISQPRNGHHCRLYSSIEAGAVTWKSCFRRQPAGNRATPTTAERDETVTDEVNKCISSLFLERYQKIPLSPVLFQYPFKIPYNDWNRYKGKILFDKRFAETVTSAMAPKQNKALSPHPRWPLMSPIQLAEIWSIEDTVLNKRDYHCFQLQQQSYCTFHSSGR